MKKKENNIKEISTREFVDKYNSCHDRQIDRHTVYKMIKNGELIARKGYRGEWLIETGEIKPKHKLFSKDKKYLNTKQFTEEYNKKHPKNPLTIRHVRLLLETGELKGVKKKGIWVISSSPKKRIKYK